MKLSADRLLEERGARNSSHEPGAMPYSLPGRYPPFHCGLRNRIGPNLIWHDEPYVPRGG